MSLQNSCRDTVNTNSVNIICKDGVVSCDPTVLASVSQIWRNILMTTDEDTKYILAPDYTLKFMKSYLLSCIFGNEKQESTRHFDFDKKDRLEIRHKVNSQNEMLETIEKETVNDRDISKINLDFVDTIVHEFLEKVAEVCVNDDEKHKYKEGDRNDDYNLRYYYDYQTGKDTPFRLAEYVVMREGHRRKVRKVMDAYKSLLIETFQVENNRSCNICLKTFSKASYCREHMISIHSERKKYQCDKCESKFSTINGLKLHMNTSHENESKDPFICTVCGAVFLHKRSLFRHCKAEQHDSYPKASSKGKESKVKNRTKCSICHKFIVNYMLETHIEESHSDKAREFKCSEKECGFKTKRHDSLQRHNREVHQKFMTELEAIGKTFVEGSSYQCPDCKNVLRKRKDIEDHLVGKICSLTCKICNKTFSRKHNMKQHMKKIHSKNVT